MCDAGPVNVVGRLAGTVAAAGATGLVYSAGYEVRAFRLRRAQLPVLPPDARPIKLLHISDIHLLPTQRRKLAWLSGLADLRPDLVVNTGDNIAHRDAVEPLMRALRPLTDVPGVFVFGSNDYWAPMFKNPVRYLLGSPRRVLKGGPLPWRDLQTALVRAGWVDLANTRATVHAGGLRIACAGVDDPHLGYDRLNVVAGPADVEAGLRLGVSHAPYLRVLDQFTADGYDAILAGHTHGGQLRLPLKGAIVTNCDLDTRRSRGVSRHVAGGRAAWMNVSAGCGTSPYAPVRFCCHPEASLLTLVPRQA
jgi:predicted MPP superfamily phosphohydrolase